MASIRKRRNKWQVQIRRKGSRPLTRSFLARKDAETWSRLIELQVDRRELPADARELDVLTLGDLVRRYRDRITPRKRRAEIETIELNAFLRHRICSVPLSELSTADFANYRDERLALVKPATIRRQLSPVRHLLRIASEEWNLPLTQNPLERLRIHGVDQRRNRRLRSSELAALLSEAANTRNKYVRPIILIALETGMRRGEILSLKQSDVSFERQILRIETSKNGYEREIPLTRAAMSLLRPLARQDDKVVFPITPNALKLAFKRLVQRTKITDFRFHDLRHEAISRFFEKGLTPPEVTMISGHRDQRMLFRYAHATRESALRKLEGNQFN